MRKRTLKTLVSTVAGAVGGGIVVFALLSALGKSTPSPSKTPFALPLGSAPAGSPVPTAGSAVSSPEPTSRPGEFRSAALGVSFVIPKGYRLADTLNAVTLDKHPAQLTLTRASVSAEEEYGKVLDQLASQQAATDAPIFAPGQTITLHEITNPNAEVSDSPLARGGKEEITADAGLTGTRYRRVEGIGTYDMTYFSLPGDRVLGVQLSYSTTDGRFDEEAYRSLLQSLQPL